MRGRKPTEDKVVPLSEDGAQLHNLDARAQARREELRPEGLTGELRWTFDRLALPLCHPTVDRLKPHIQACFSAEALVLAQIDALADPAGFDIAAAFDAALEGAGDDPD